MLRLVIWEDVAFEGINCQMLYDVFLHCLVVPLEDTPSSYTAQIRESISGHTFLQFVLFTFGIDYLRTWLQWTMLRLLPEVWIF